MRDHRTFLSKAVPAIKAVNIQTWQNKRLFMCFLMTSLIFFTLITGAQADETNPYAQNYKEQNTNQLKSLDPNPDTKLYVSNHKEDDNISMLENGYDMIGSSGFSAFEASPDLALQHAKAIKADTVLIYKKYESAKTASSKLQLVKEAAKKGGEIDPNDLEEEATKYYFYASYWAKLPMPLFGVHIIKLKKQSSDNDAEAVEEPGLRVIAVIKDSPAAKAGIVRGDTLMKLGDVPMTTKDDLFAAVRKYAGQTIPVTIERKDEAAQLTVTLNSKK